jgi:alkyl hydroperoxide reductase subunit AhpC
MPGESILRAFLITTMSKTLTLIPLIACLLFGFTVHQEPIRKLPVVDVKTLDGQIVKSNSVLNKNGLTVINFWATWCKPCVLELNTIKELYGDWKKETNVKIIAVSIDDSRNISKVGPMANGKGWEYDILLDPNGDFKRSLNVNNIPHTFLVNEKGEILWQHNSFAPGDEDELFEIIKKFTPKP